MGVIIVNAPCFNVTYSTDIAVEEAWPSSASNETYVVPENITYFDVEYTDVVPCPHVDTLDCPETEDCEEIHISAVALLDTELAEELIATVLNTTEHFVRIQCSPSEAITESDFNLQREYIDGLASDCDEISCQTILSGGVDQCASE